MNPFEELLETKPVEPIEIPDLLGPFQPLIRDHNDTNLPPKKVFDADASERTMELWKDDLFYETAGADPIYLTVDRSKVDLITLVHRLYPKAAPYENRMWMNYIKAGGLHHNEDSEYFIHPLSAFFFVRWMVIKYHSEFLTRSNLRDFLSTHAVSLIKIALDQFKAADKLSYNYAIEGITAKIDVTNLTLILPIGPHKIKLHNQPVGSIENAPPAMVKDLLCHSFRSPCDSSGRVLRKVGCHPPFYKPQFNLPLWQRVYAEIGGRMTRMLMDVPDLAVGCLDCVVRDDCSFVVAHTDWSERDDVK